MKHVEVKRKQDDATFRALRQSFLYNGQVLDAFEFWEQHGFSNLVPRLVGGGADKKLTVQDKRAVREEFPLILDAVRPQRVLIASGWAVEVLKDKMDTGTYVKVGDNDWWEMRFGGIPVVGIYHPSGWKYDRHPYTLDRARHATERLRNMK